MSNRENSSAPSQKEAAVKGGEDVSIDSGASQQPQASVDDIRLLLEVKTIELELATLQIQTVNIEKESMASDLKNAQQQLEQSQLQTKEYKAAFEELKDWHLKLKKKSDAAESQLKTTQSNYETLFHQFNTSQMSVSVDLRLIEEYENQMVEFDSLLKMYEVRDIDHQKLLQARDAELHSYKDAMYSITKTLKQHEEEKERELVELKHTNTVLRDTLENTRKISQSKQQLIEISDNDLTSAATIENSIKDNILLELIPENVHQKFSQDLNAVVTIQKCIHIALTLLHYLDSSYFSDLINKSYQKLAEKERVGFIRWIVVASQALCQILLQSVDLSYTLLYTDPSTFSKFSESEVCNSTLTSGLNALNKILKSIQTMSISEAIDLTHVQKFATGLSTGIFVEIIGTSKTKVLSTDFLLAAHSLKCLVHLPLCHACYSPSANPIIAAESWQKLVKLTSQFSALLFSEKVDRMFLKGYSTLSHPAETSKTLQNFNMNKKILEDFVFSVDEKEVKRHETSIKPSIDKLIESFEAMTEVFLQPAINDTGPPIKPWAYSLLKFKATITRYKEIEQEYEQTKINLENSQLQCQKDADHIANLENNVKELNKKVENITMEFNRNILYKQEADNMKVELNKLLQLLDESRCEMAEAMQAKKEKSEENEILSQKVIELNQKLDTIRHHSYQQFQNDYNTKELANFRIVVSNLEKELHTLRMRSAIQNAHDIQLPKHHRITGTTVKGVNATKTDKLESSNESERFLTIFNDFRLLQQAIWMHNFRVPIYDPNSSSSYNNDAYTLFQNEHDALRLSMASIKRKIETELNSMAFIGKTSNEFCETISSDVRRYIRNMTEAQFPKAEKSDYLVARINLPEVPEWLRHKSNRKLVLTKSQISDVNERIFSL